MAPKQTTDQPRESSQKKIRNQKTRQTKKPATTQELTSIDPNTLGLIIAHYGKKAWVQPDDPTQAKILCHLRFNLPTLVAGDRVVWEKSDQNKGIITHQLPRNNELAKSDHRDQKKPMVANVDNIWIVIAPVPVFSTSGIDRYLIAAELAHINVNIIINKIDLLSDLQRTQLLKKLAVYSDIGYLVLPASTVSQESIPFFKAELTDKISLLVGQSGVGKSSLVSTLLPNESIRIGGLSNLQQGCHTTTSTRLIDLPWGGYLVDSPGLREFGLSHLTTESLLYGFKEFRPFWQHCQFSNCSHRNDLGCALRQATESGHITQDRFNSFQALNNLLKKSN